MITKEFIINVLKNKEQIKSGINYRRSQIIDNINDMEDMRYQAALPGLKVNPFGISSGSGHSDPTARTAELEIDNAITALYDELNRLSEKEEAIVRIMNAFAMTEKIMWQHYYTAYHMYVLVDTKREAIARELRKRNQAIGEMLDAETDIIFTVVNSDITTADIILYPDRRMIDLINDKKGSGYFEKKIMRNEK